MRNPNPPYVAEQEKKRVIMPSINGLLLQYFFKSFPSEYML